MRTRAQAARNGSDPKLDRTPVCGWSISWLGCIETSLRLSSQNEKQHRHRRKHNYTADQHPLRPSLNSAERPGSKQVIEIVRKVSGVSTKNPEHDVRTRPSDKIRRDKTDHPGDVSH